MKEYTKIVETVKAMRWDGFVSMPELIEMKGDAINLLLRHDESVLIFDNAFELSSFVCVSKGQWIVKERTGIVVYSERDFLKSYKEV